jgi:hypothetical protein
MAKPEFLECHGKTTSLLPGGHLTYMEISTLYKVLLPLRTVNNTESIIYYSYIVVNRLHAATSCRKVINFDQKAGTKS